MSHDESGTLRQQLEQAITAQESLRSTLGDVIVDATIAALRRQLAEIAPGPPVAVAHQRKMVTILFTDVVGSTSLLGELDPEENLAIMDAALQQLAAPIGTFGGQVTRFMGDGFLAVFGLSQARENDPEMAVRAGLGVLQEARAIAQSLEQEYQLQGFQVRVGINTGLVVSGGVTEAEGTIMGNAVNLAARLETAAPPSGLLISQNTYHHVRGIFDLEDHGIIQAKGFSEPVKVYRVIQARPRASRQMRRGIEGIQPRMVGRDKELVQFQEIVESIVHTQESRFITLLGEAGLGKSRLLAEFEKWLDLQPTRPVLFKGRASLETLDQPYALLKDLVALHFELLDDDPIAAIEEKLINGLGKTLPRDEDLTMKAHFCGHLLGYDFRSSSYLQGILDAPQQMRERALLYWTDFFRGASQTQPVAIFLEDIHWADESSLDAFLHFSQELWHQPIVFVALSRPILLERRPSWGDGPHHTQIALRRLSREESEQLLREVLHEVEETPETWQEMIVNNAEGNPFYLEELVRMLVEDHVLVPGDQGWRVHPDKLVHLHVPATLTGVIQARLDGLPAQERAVLQRAAVVGRVFWDAAVAFLGQEGPPDHGVLDDLQKREIVFRQEPSAFSDAMEYIFKHSILRDVTYESVLIRTRKAYHGLIADWLIAHSGERTREMPGLIAGHLEKAGRANEALEYLCRAAEAAAANYANDEAADFYTRALAITPQEDLERRFHLLLGQERIWSAKGNLVAQRQVLDELDEITQSLADGRKRAEVTLRRAWYAFWRSDFEATLAASQQALTLGESMADPKLVGQAHYAVAWAFLHLKETDQALRHAHMALQAARRAHDRRSEGNTLNILGLSSIALGEFAQARDHLEQFLAVAQELGDRERELTSSSNLGVALMFLGDFRAAGERFHHTLRLARQSGDRTSEGTALVNLAWAKGSQGDWAEAVQYAEAGLTSKRQFEQAEAIAEALLWLAHAQSGLGQFDDALAAYRESLAIRMELGQTHLAMGVHAGLARAWLTQGDLTAAMIHAEEIIGFLADGGSLEGTWEPLRIRLSCFRVLQAAQDPRAPAMLEGAYHILQARAAKIPSEADRRIFVENIPWHREILAAWQDR